MDAASTPETNHPDKLPAATSLANASLPPAGQISDQRLRNRLNFALKAYAQADDARQEVCAMRRLRSALRAYEKQKAAEPLTTVPGKLLAYSYINFGSYLVERRRQLEVAREALIEGLAYCERAGADFAIRLRGTSSLARYYCARGNLEQARALCEKSLERWDRTQFRHAAVGKMLRTYGEVLAESGMTELAWRQFEAAREFFAVYRREVPARYSELLYVEALKCWGKYMLTLPGKSLEQCLDLIREISTQSDILLGDDYHTALSSRLELIHARILARDYQGAERDCFEMSGLLQRLQLSASIAGAGKSPQESEYSSFPLTPEETQILATQCEVTALLAVTQFFQGNEQTALALMRDAGKLAFSIRDLEASSIKAVFYSLGGLWEHRRKGGELKALNDLLKKTARVVAELRAEEGE